MARDIMMIVAVGLPEATKFFIKNKLQPLTANFSVPGSNEELKSLMNMRNMNIGCVLLDTDYIDDRGLSACEAIRSVNKKVPIYVLSSESDRNYYVKAIRWGVSGFILKPFKDDSLRVKLLDCYHAQSEKNAEMITFDLEKYLFGEFRKAEKGSFPLTFMFATVHLDDPEEQGNPMSHAYYLNLFYETIRKLFWDTDAFIRYNSKYYLGVFPFCGKANITTLTGKMHAAFEALYTERAMPAYVKLVTAFSSYPDDSRLFLDLQRMLSDRVRLQMGDHMVDWFI